MHYRIESFIGGVREGAQAGSGVSGYREMHFHDQPSLSVRVCAERPAGGFGSQQGNSEEKNPLNYCDNYSRQARLAAHLWPALADHNQINPAYYEDVAVDLVRARVDDGYVVAAAAWVDVLGAVKSSSARSRLARCVLEATGDPLLQGAVDAFLYACSKQAPRARCCDQAFVDANPPPWHAGLFHLDACGKQAVQRQAARAV